MQDKLTPEFERIAELAEQQPPEVQEVFQFMLAVPMEESGKAELINAAQVDGPTHLLLRKRGRRRVQRGQA